MRTHRRQILPETDDCYAPLDIVGTICLVRPTLVLVVPTVVLVGARF